MRMKRRPIAIINCNHVLIRPPLIGFGQLTGNPMGARACGHTQPQKLAAEMLQDQKSIQQPWNAFFTPKGHARGDRQETQ
jgi:hypothetical protein